MGVFEFNLKSNKKREGAETLALQTLRVPAPSVQFQVSNLKLLPQKYKIKLNLVQKMLISIFVKLTNVIYVWIVFIYNLFCEST